MAFLTTLATYVAKFVFFLAVAVVGFIAGKKYKAGKVQKNGTSGE